MAEIVGTLRALLDNDNAKRSAAEQSFQDARRQQPAATVSALFQALAEQQLEEPVREQAAVLLRQCLGKLRDDGSTWSQLGEAAQAACKAKLLELLELEPAAKVRRKIADIVQSLGNQLIDLEEDERPQNAQVWPELMPALMRMVMDRSKADGLKADALWTVTELLASIWQIFVANANNTLMVLRMSFASASEAVRGHAGQLLCELADNLSTKEDRATFVPLIPDVCGVLQQLASSAHTTECNALLQKLQGTPNSSDFFKDSVGQHLLPVLCTIAKSHQSEETQRLALEVLCSLLEGKPKAISNVPGYVQQTLEVCVHFLMKLSDDLDEWGQEEDEEAEDEDNFENGKEVIDRVSKCMGEKFPAVMETLKPAIATLFQAGAWKQTVAGLAILATIAEFVDDEATVLHMVGAVKAQLKASNPRVRHTAWSALAQFAEDHSEAVTSESSAAEFLPEFLVGLDDPCQRVQSRCMEAFQLYGGEVERELLEPYVAEMMKKLGQKLQSSCPLGIQKKTITFVAVLAGQMEDGFAPYYAPLMPILKNLVQSLLHKTEERTLLGKTFECISLLAASVGPEGFRADAEVIMQAMIQATQVPNLPSNDPVKEYMLEASQRICVTMKGNFVPFVPHILPGILEKFTLAPKEADQALVSGLDADTEVNVTLTKENGQVKVMIMSTSEMEDLQHAVGCVHTFVEELGKAYAPFVAQTAQALLLVFDFSMDEEIRDMAFDTWGLLCQSAREGGQADVVGQLVQEFLKRILPKFEQAGAEGRLDEEALKTAADGVTACLKKAGPGVLSREQVRHICQVALQALSASLKRRDASEAESRKRPTDDEDQEGDDGDEEGVNLRIACCEMAGALMQHHAPFFMSECLMLCMELVNRFIQPSVRWEDHRLALFVCCDMLEHLGTGVTPHWQQFLPAMLQDVLHQSAAIRQPACYGASLAAKDPAFGPMAKAAAASLSQLVVQARTTAKKKSGKPDQACADNALSALAEILVTHHQAIAEGEAQLWSVWLNGLPCQVDSEEGIKNHRTLVRFAEAEKPQVLGEAGANLPQILAILVDVYKTEMADDDTSRGIGQLVLKIGEQRLDQVAQKLKDKQRKKLLRIHREAKEARPA
uniref:TOG domain-containing protein n=1 Tax=Zooxanthella nutricula TaxID=1333877 RepID=A0A7S2KBP1_9DINO